MKKPIATAKDIMQGLKKRHNKRQPMTDPKPTCPDCGLPLQPSDTRWGALYVCPTPGCTVKCWDGSTSTPANDVVRALRHRCHELFDPLWKDEEGPFAGRRWNAYWWLSKQLGIDIKDTHFGMFDGPTCERAIAILEQRP